MDPSFDDFTEHVGISAVSAASLGVNNSTQRRKHVPSTLESSRLPARKRGKQAATESIYSLENSKQHLCEDDSWVDRYQPETQVLSNSKQHCNFISRRMRAGGKKEV